MIYANIRSEDEESFCLVSPDGKSFLSWALLREQFPNEKVIQGVKSLLDFIESSEVLVPFLESKKGVLDSIGFQEFEERKFAKPFQPKSFRDFYCFEEHVKKGRAGRGLEMIPAWYEFPVFYYSNHLSIRGPGDDIPYPKSSEKLDYELEIGCILGKSVKDASLEEARDAIFGYCLVNDFSARDFQKQEMPLNMGPAKGKDFATSFGPVIIGKEEIEDRRASKGYDLKLSAYVNSSKMSEGNWQTIHYSFEEMIVRASQNCELKAGELLGSGTLGAGCLMELNIDREKALWLKPGDFIELKWDDLFVLRNRIAE